VRQGIRSLLESHPGFTVIGEVSDGAEAVEMADKQRPEVVLMDISMPNLNGLDATRQISERKLGTRVIILSMHNSSSYAVRALKSGADGYILKDADQEEIIQAIQTVMQGRRYLSPAISNQVLDVLLNPRNGSEDPFNSLTNRERQVLQMIAEGNTNAAVAEKLFLSPRTVEVHRANMMHKLNIKSQAELVRFAIQRGLVQLDSTMERTHADDGPGEDASRQGPPPGDEK
jgi:DNA-binding NarL/FixJ family response regulator